MSVCATMRLKVGRKSYCLLDYDMVHNTVS